MPTQRSDILADARIIYVNNFSGPGLGGGEVQLLHMLEGAIAEGMDVHLIGPPASGIASAARERGALVTEIELRPASLATSFPRVRRTLDELEPQIVQGTGFLTNQLARAAAPAGAKVVSTVHVEPGASLHDGGSKAGLAVRELADRVTRPRADAVVAVSHAIAESLIAHGTSADRLLVIHNGVDVEALARQAAHDPLPEPVRELARSRVTLVGVLSRLEPVKGVADFVRAAALVPVSAGTDPERPARFVIAGSGSQAQHIRELRAELGLDDRVLVVEQTPSAAALLGVCDIVVVPSLSEGFGIVAAEAMALGKPVVATAVGGLPEVVEDGVTGVLVPAADPKALAGAIEALLRDPSRAAAYGTAGRARAEERFAVTRMVAGYLDLYEELLRS